MGYFTITTAGRQVIHQLLDEALDEMVRTQDLYGEAHGLHNPARSRVEGLKIAVDLKVQFTPQVDGRCVGLQELEEMDGGISQIQDAG